MRFLLALAVVLLPLMAPDVARAQAAATLVADRVFVPAGGQSLVAEGNVEVFFDGTRLTAQRIVFDEPSDRLTIEGPIFIEAADGTILTADVASLDPQLQNGLLRGARLVLDQQLQLAANQIDRVEGRYTQLYQVAATSCHICAEGEAPLWEIRARRVIHDDVERQLYFDDATFRVAGLPIFYIPRMRLPDPTLTRATGLLIPQISSSDTLGVGIKLPYFIKLGDHRDLTLTPYLSPSTATLEGRYRQAFRRGDLTLDAAVTQDDLTSDIRAYVFADGVFDLGHDVVLRFDIEAASDNAYLLEYGYSDKDRLDSQIALERVRDRDLARATLTYYDTLRDSEPSAELPPYLLDFSRERRLTPRWGGTLTLTTDVQGHYRDIDTDVDGRDVARFGLGADWQQTHVTDFGLLAEGRLGTDLDYYKVQDDSVIGDSFRSTLFATATLRFPMVRRSAQATHVLEPVLQLAWSDVQGGRVRNEDSTATEFDQANLFALSRFAGEDAVETGVRGAAGLTWTRLGAQGWDSTLTLGRLFRAERDPVFSSTSGLGAPLSDWLLAGQLRTPSGFALDSRVIFDSQFDVTKSETRGSWSGGKLDLATSFIFLPADLAEVRPSSAAEWTIDADYRFDSTWALGVDARYDVTTSDPTRAGLDIGWQNECVTVDFSVSRRFTSSTTVDPSTDFGLAIGLNGFSAGRSFDTPTHRCTN